MAKYVAFIDILGFKDRISKISHAEAEEFIRSLGRMIYRAWGNAGLNDNQRIKGYFISDSIIVNTEDSTGQTLKTLVDFLLSLYKRAFSEHSILLRGAIAKGDFSLIPSYGFDNLEKGLLVGEAYIKAYTMESTKKGSFILFDSIVKEDIEHLEQDEYIIDSIDGNDMFTLQWANIDFLLQPNHLDKFVDMGCRSNWLPHYYQTLYLFIVNCGNARRKKQVFDTIIESIRRTRADYWRAMDKFISNAFSNDVSPRFQMIFLNYLREHIDIQNVAQIPLGLVAGD